MWLAIASAIASLVGGAVSTYQTIKENNTQAKEIAQQYQQKADERARQAKALMSQQKSSFLKGGVYFDGTPEAVIDETYDTYLQDINALNTDSTTAQNRLIRQGKTAFWNYLANPLGSSGTQSLGSIFQTKGATTNSATAS